jgi:hypothetical protein
MYPGGQALAPHSGGLTAVIAARDPVWTDRTGRGIAIRRRLCCNGTLGAREQLGLGRYTAGHELGDVRVTKK